MAAQELQTSRRIVIEADKAPASLDPKVVEHPHLRRGQAIARGILLGIPDLTTILGYEGPQAVSVKKSLGLVAGQPSADAAEGFVYRASTGNDRSLARITYRAGVYTYIGEGPTKLNELDMRLKRRILTDQQYAEQRRLAEPLGTGTGDFQEFIAGIYAIDPKLLKGNEWKAVFEATHLSTGLPLRREGSVAGNLLYPLGKTALYRLHSMEAESGSEDAEGLFVVRFKKDGKEQSVTEQVRDLGKVVDPHGSLRLFARVANVRQLTPV